MKKYDLTEEKRKALDMAYAAGYVDRAFYLAERGRLARELGKQV